MFGKAVHEGVFKLLRRNLSNLVDVSPEVGSALKENRAVVALESTIITHGMPYPSNHQTAVSVENIIRNQGAVPATIAILDGRVKIGLSSEELERLSKPDLKCIKTSRRDIPFVLGNKLSGGTTVSGTLYFAHKVGVNIFVTGGVGGVHRKGELTLDVSADLNELGRTPMMVISSGVKSILDIGRTLEYLETQGVCVVSYSDNNEFPAFYSEKSGFKAPYNVTNPVEAASLLKSLKDIGLNSGMLLAVPIPAAHSLDVSKMEEVIKQAVAEAESNGIGGKDVTPFILKRVTQETDGLSLNSNIALIENNALVGAQIAVEYGNLMEQKSTFHSFSSSSGSTSSSKKASKRPVVVGGSVLDCVMHLEDDLKMDGRTHVGKVLQGAGGVGRNLGDALGKLVEPHHSPLFISAVGKDQYGLFILHSLSHLDTSAVATIEGNRTASYCGLFDKRGECKFGIGDMSIHSTVSCSQISKHEDIIQESPLVVLDGNLSKDAIFDILRLCEKYSVPVWYEPTDIAKATKPFESDLWKNLSFLSPNVNELKEIAKHFGVTLKTELNNTDVGKFLNQLILLATPIAEELTAIMITMGSLGILMVSRLDAHDKVLGTQVHTGSKIQARYYPVTKIDTIVNVSGAGDCTAAGFMAGMLKGLTEPECIDIGLKAAVESLNSPSAVPKTFHYSYKTYEKRKYYQLELKNNNKNSYKNY